MATPYPFMDRFFRLEPSPDSRSLARRNIFVSEKTFDDGFRVGEHVFLIVTNKSLPCLFQLAKVYPSSSCSTDTVLCDPSIEETICTVPGTIYSGLWGSDTLIYPLWIRYPPPKSLLRGWISMDQAWSHEIEQCQDVIERQIIDQEITCHRDKIVVLYKTQRFLATMTTETEYQFDATRFNDDLIHNVLYFVNHYPVYATSTARFVWTVHEITSPKIEMIKHRMTKCLGGLQHQSDLVVDIVYNILYQPDQARSNGLLICGRPGTGKSTLAQALALEFEMVGINVVCVESHKYLTWDIRDLQVELEQIFERAMFKAPSLIIMDQLDVIFHQNPRSGTRDQRLPNVLARLMDKIHHHPVVCLATSQMRFGDCKLTKSGRFDVQIELPFPNQSQRRKIVLCILERDDSQFRHSKWIDSLAELTSGFSGGDLKKVVDIYMNSSQDISGKMARLEVGDDDRLVRIVRQIRSTMNNEWSVSVPRIKWTDIGGNHRVKRQLIETIEWPLRFPERFVRFGINPLRGILLYGPPGNSKTLLAKAVANEFHLNFMAVKGPQILDKWVGESEKTLCRIFSMARENGPTILFFDEIDSIAGRRGAEDSASGISDRILAQLLVELDGIRPLDKVVFLAATNRPDILDPALLRPGRMDHLVYIGLPDWETRKEILQLQARRLQFDAHINWDNVCAATGGYSGAELVALCQQAGFKALEHDPNARLIQQVHLEAAMELVLPRTGPAVLKYYDEFGKRNRRTL